LINSEPKLISNPERGSVKLTGIAKKRALAKTQRKINTDKDEFRNQEIEQEPTESTELGSPTTGK
jgi:hypothetical protein